MVVSQVKEDCVAIQVINVSSHDMISVWKSLVYCISLVVCSGLRVEIRSSVNPLLIHLLVDVNFRSSFCLKVSIQF
jgi:hypothetical protein